MGGSGRPHHRVLAGSEEGFRATSTPVDVRRVPMRSKVLVVLLACSLWSIADHAGGAEAPDWADKRGGAQMQYIENAEEITGYKVRIWSRSAFSVVGYTTMVGKEASVEQFSKDVSADGRLDGLIRSSKVAPWVLGLGSWDPECEGKGDYRYTICIEETQHTNLTPLEKRYPQYPLFRKEIGASDWLCFENFDHGGPNAYELIKLLGYKFHTGGYDVGLHFDAWAPGVVPLSNTMEFWITVVR
jgi:hypothetical protein